MRRSILPLPLSKVKPVPPPFEFIALAAAKVDPFGARGSEQCAGEPQARICAGGGDVTRVSILEPAFAAVHESAVGTAPTICSSARRSAVCRTSQRHPMSATVRNRRNLVLRHRIREGRQSIHAAVIRRIRDGPSVIVKLRRDQHRSTSPPISLEQRKCLRIWSPQPGECQ